MTLTIFSLILIGLLFATFGILRPADRCDRNCGACSEGCRGTKENTHV